MHQNQTIRGEILIHTHKHTRGKIQETNIHSNKFHPTITLEKFTELLFGAYNRNIDFNQELFR